MTEITLELDMQASKSLSDLMIHYKVKSKAQIIKKALYLLQIASKVENTKGELIARKNGKETRVIIN